MSKTTQTAKTISLIINGIKGSINDFSLEELTNLLKQNKCPYWKKISTILLSHNLIIKDNKNKYNFITTSPIYYSIFETAINKIKVSQKDYTKKWIYKTDDSSKFQSENIEKAIQLLKECGYKIFKEV